jgi:hypothetical protein
MRKYPLVCLLIAFLLAPNISLGQETEKDTKKENEPAKMILKDPSINFKGLITESLFTLSILNVVRLKDKRTRSEFGGPYFEDWIRSVKSIPRSFNDGDPFYPNWIGHPMMGSWMAFTYANNQKGFKNVVFGTKDYFKAKGQQFIYVFVLSSCFEMCPAFSETAWGNLGYRQGKNGYIDQIVTPIFGILWSIAEDAINHFFIQKKMAENANKGNLWLIILNPTRSLANSLKIQYPWNGTLSR